MARYFASASVIHTMLPSGSASRKSRWPQGPPALRVLEQGIELVTDPELRLRGWLQAVLRFGRAHQVDGDGVHAMTAPPPSIACGRYDRSGANATGRPALGGRRGTRQTGRVQRVTSVLLVLLGSLAGPMSAHAAQAPQAFWEQGFFTTPPRDLAAAAKNVDDADANIVILFEERVHTFESDGRNRSRYRRVYKVLSQEAVENGTVEIGWAPWHEDQPTFRARVVTKDGRAFLLDPKTIELSGVKGGDPDMFTDRRVLRAPLPGLARGAVVEEEVMTESRPIVEGLGASGGYVMGGFVPVRLTRLVLEAPRAVPLAVDDRPAGTVRTTRTEKDGRVRIVFEAGPLSAFTPPDEGWPDDVPFVPLVRYATGPSWRAVASRYAEIVDRQLAGAETELASWVKDAREAGPARPSRRELAARLLARLHRDVRYTGVEFEDASIVPRRPAEVLARGYGDCKDQAALLVALLRAAGMTAHVALLRVGGTDVDARLPALDGFDHAIVLVEPLDKGTPALWVDPTNAYAPLGELPGSDVNRHALLAAPKTEGLVVTPPAATGHSRVHELRRIVLEESGRPRVFERTTAEGAAARSYRRAWATTPKKTMQEQLLAYVKQQYTAKGLTRFDVGTPADMSKPPVLELEATEAEIGSVWDEGAEVLVRSGETLDRLPSALRTSDSDTRAPAKPRAVDYVIGEPYVHELRYEIVPPHGFSPDPLPAGGTRPLGTATLRSTYAVDARGVVSATFLFDSGKPRLSPAELERLKAEIKTYLAANAPVVRFHADGAVALQSGKVREALSIFRRLDGEHPHQALHARQIATAVLAAGLGQAARDEAHRAVAADPKSAEAERVLGWTLEHDLLGRRFGTGADLKEAEAAYRRALVLDPKDRTAEASLAILLEHDASGQRSYPAARLAEIERLYEDLDKSGEQGFAVNHQLVLLYQQRFREVIEHARGLGGSPAENMIVLAAISATEGTTAALREAASRLTVSEQRAEAVRGAGAELLRLRRYAEAAVMFEQAARDASQGAALRSFAERLRHARRRETVTLDARKPADLSKLLLAEVIAAIGEGRTVPASVGRLTSPALAKELSERNTRSEVQVTIRNFTRATGGIPIPSLVDLLVGMDLSVEGQPGVGYRVRLPPSDANAQTMELFLATLPEGLRVIALGGQPLVVAREALRQVRAGHLPAARAWLDWMLEEASLGSAAEPLSGSLLARVWTHDESERGQADVELGAAVVLAYAPEGPDGPADALPVLRREQAKTASGPRRLAIDLALVRALSETGKLADAEAVAADLQRRYPSSIQAVGQRLALLDRLGRRAEVLRQADAAVAAHPDEPVLERMRADAQMDAGKVTDAEAAFSRLTASPRSTPHDHNAYAWLRLVRGDTGDATLATARRAVEMSSRKNAGILHTLAAVLAERDQPEEAREVLLESLDQRPNDDPTEDDRYVLGRIAESYGFPDTARGLYGQLPQPARAIEISSYTLAQRRLTRLAGKGPSPAAPPAKMTGGKVGPALKNAGAR
jgi:tetratricopeptide (TPR) repeat protein/transglutaminase-like putative cysteine protease